VRTGRGQGTRGVGPWLLWFGVLGGITAWGVHLAVAWFVLEVACISPTDGPWQDNRGGSVSTGAWALVAAGTAVPWVVAVLAVVACLVVRRRTRRLAEQEEADPLASERTAFLVVLGLFLNLFAPAAITGGIVAELTLDACG
jgi:hypothetical protein